MKRATGTQYEVDKLHCFCEHPDSRVLLLDLMGLALHGGCSGLKSSHHGHSHGMQIRTPSTSTNDGCETTGSRNINVRAAVIHVVGDLVQSIGVFIAAVLIKFCPSARWADPACTLLCCILVLGTSIGVARDAVIVLLEACPSIPALQPAALVMRLRSVEGIRGIHDLHVWSLTPGQSALTAHLIIDSAVDHETVLRKAQKVLRGLPELEHITLQVSNGSTS
ncbi:Putative zinc transporter protein DDB G0283629 [Gryllus bimaculatus]|nr:Putative zinc transporter protein DDB G0283629 [Gryllus bimaculatus]